MASELLADGKPARPRWTWAIVAFGLVASCGCQTEGTVSPTVTPAMADLVAPLILPCHPSQDPARETGGKVDETEKTPTMRPPAGRPSAIPPACADYALDLETALGLAGAENPTIALAAEAVSASLALQLEARSLLLPTVDGGVTYDHHRGNLLSARGIIRDVDREALYAGAGASAAGAGTVAVPGARVTAHLADALLAPRMAGERVAGRRFEASAVNNAVLLDVVNRYFDLAGAEGIREATRQSQEDLGEVARLTANFARTGQGREGDAERARDEALLLAAQEQATEEQVAVASAELAQLLSMDPAVRLHTPPGPLPLIHLVDPGMGLESLLAVALQNRPEIAARSADIALAATRLQQERLRPMLPFLSIGFSAGTFGGGGNATVPRFGQFSGRTDFDALAVWRLDNLGFGNLVVQKRARAQVSLAEAERNRVVNEIRREVSDALALSASRLLEVEAAGRRVGAAEEGYRLDLLRIKNLQGRPIEVLTSATQVNAARQDQVRAIVAYNQAQYQLFVALGQPPTMAGIDCGGPSSSIPR